MRIVRNSGMALSLMLLGGCSVLRHTEPPLIGLANIQLQDTTQFERRYQLQLRAQNPNDFDLAVTGLRCTLYIDDQAFARGVSPAAVIIPRFGEAVLTVSVVSDPQRVFAQLQDSARMQGEPVAYG